ncbi:MAG: recombinase family protein [Candidatus Saccharibacteria bacterium]
MATTNKIKPSRKRYKKKPLTNEDRLDIERKLAIIKDNEPEAFNLPTSKRSVQELADHFIKVSEGSNFILPKEKRRYVIYIRKSTDDETKQIRSLDDQKSECLALAKVLEVDVKECDIFEESASAKTSGNRPIFDAMILGFKTGKYHGLISWSPDRLSRNMKEAGEIIEMIDQEQIQDLQFKTYQFENSPNGKMLLGILFATSKQYSDKLGIDVSRGITGNIKEGKYNGINKKGYYVDKSTGYFIPDGYNWDLMREAVNMRINKGATNKDVAKYLLDSHLSIRKDQDEPQTLVKVDIQMVGDMFADPFYFGLYRFGKNIADLTEIYNFLPLITPDEYVVLNKSVAGDFNEKYAGKSSNNKRLGYGLLRGKVICDYCGEFMQFQHTEIKRGENKGQWVISFYCRNANCQRHKTAENKANGLKLSKSIRAKYVMAYIEYTLRNCTKKSKEAYRQYIGRLQAKLAQNRAIAKRKLSDARSSLKLNEAQYSRYQQFQIDNPKDYKKHHDGKLEHYSSLVRVDRANIEGCNKDLEKLNADLPTEQEFYELIKSYLVMLLKTHDLLEQDAICNELVSNLRAGNDVISVITLNPPYNLLVDLANISTGGP